MVKPTLRRVLGMGTLLLIALATVWALRPPPLAVETTLATRGDLTATVVAEGRVRVKDVYVVAAPVDGDLERIAVEPGDTVRPGAPVARIWPIAPRPLDARSRAEAEAHLRAGRPEQALAVLSELDAWVEETGIPPLSAIPTWARVMHLSGKHDGFGTLMARLRDSEVAVLRPICRAYLAFLEATEALCAAIDPELTNAAFQRAEQEARRWPFLLRYVMPHAVLALIIAGHDGQARLALRRTQRLMDAFPSPWVTAVLRRIEGTLLAATGNWGEGKHLVESAIATFELAQDRCDAALCRCLSAALSDAYGEPGAKEKNAQKRFMRPGCAQSKAMMLSFSGGPGRGFSSARPNPKPR